MLDANGATVFETSFSFESPLTPIVPVLNAPYSANEISVSRDPKGVEQSQAAGKVWRDSLGRIRRERSLYMGPGISEPPRSIEIDDVVAGYRYTLDARRKLAHRSRLLKPGETPALAEERTIPLQTATASANGAVTVTERASAPRVLTATRPTSADSPAGPQTERLGTREIEGIRVEGTRYTSKIPGAIGETWTSPELQVNLIVTTIHPSHAEQITRLTSVLRADPDAALFKIPDGYAIKDEAGEFSIQFSARK